jgi:hypothetical protein
VNIDLTDTMHGQNTRVVVNWDNVAYARDVSNSTVGGGSKTHLQFVGDTNLDLYVGETLAEIVRKLQSS